jgi:Lon protease-like protein
MATATERLPLFPLSSVLYPRGLIGLRIFESRYLDMVKDRLRVGQGFGIVANLNNTEHAVVGTEAMIIDFSTLEDGLLGLQCRGHRRFRVHQTTTQADGLLIGEVEWWPPEPSLAVRPEHGTLQTLIREMARQEVLAKELDIDTDQASELSFGLASILPLDLLQAQYFLELQDPNTRLNELMAWVQAHAGALESSDAQ